ncbi:MAG TPA: hypothetical protein VK658_27050 [Chryseolinea sp.]|nr:hypothetical protein [Chryseolinea sp.]
MNPSIRHDVLIAVHPFEFLSNVDGIETIGRCLQLELITGLSKFRQFTLSYSAGRPPDHTRPAYVVRGSVAAQNQAFKITIQIIDERETLIWAHHLGMAHHIIDQQAVDALISSIQQQLNLDLLNRRNKVGHSSPGAYEHWLYGMHELKRGTAEADAAAREHFTRSMACDPSLSLAYSGMSLSYFNEWSCQLWEQWDLNHKGAYEWARKAFDLDQQNGVAALVLGRIHVYESQYEKGEYFLREALRLNPTDADNLMQIATCFVFMGYLDEAQNLYDRGVALNPIGADQYYHIASFIALERGDDDLAIALGLKSTLPWVDFRAMMAAAYFFKGHVEEMHRWWKLYAEEFRLKINKGIAASPEESLQWLINISPYRTSCRQKLFWESILNKSTSLQPRVFARAIKSAEVNSFAAEGRLWKLAYQGTTVFLPESKGLKDLARLIAAPAQAFHCVELLGTRMTQEGTHVFDESARRAYHKRIKELRQELSDAQENNDIAVLPSLQEEYETIVAHVTAAIDRKGRVRKISDSQDKARSAVTWRIRNAIQKINEVHPVLGKHLSATVRTGFYCSYVPDTPQHWSTV